MNRLVVLVVVIGLFGWACAGDGESATATTSVVTITTLPLITSATTTEATTSTTTTTETPTTQGPVGEPFAIYVLGETATGEPGPFLVPVSRLSSGEEQIDTEMAIRSLLGGLQALEVEAGLSTAVPAGSVLLEFAVADGVAIIDLNTEFEDGGPGGSFSATAKLAQLVSTATRGAEVSAVRLLIEGEEVAFFSSEGLEISGEMTREDFTSLWPAILVNDPVWGSEVAMPFTVAGIASVFEATVQWALRDREGAVLSTGFFTALDAIPAWGAFGGEIEADLSGLESDPTQSFDGSLVVWEDGAESGAPLWEMIYPLTFTELR